jgi:hypothetical protein
VKKGSEHRAGREPPKSLNTTHLGIVTTSNI